MAERVSPFTTGGYFGASRARWVAPYLRANLPALERSLGVRLRRSPNGRLAAALGYGSFGVVFATEDGRAVKVTTDDAEPVLAYEIKALQDGADPELRRASREGFVRVDRIVRLPGEVRHQGIVVPVFAILREDVLPVSDKQNVKPDTLFALNEHFDGWAAWFALDRKSRKTKKAKLETVFGIWDGWSALLDDPTLEDFVAVQRHLWNLGIPLMDTHRKNFGWRVTPSGYQLVLFDLGGSLPLAAKDGITPIDGDAFDRYYPWNETLTRIERA